MPSQETGPNILRGKVTSRVFLGQSSTYTIETRGLALRIVSSEADHPIGELIPVRLPPN